MGWKSTMDITRQDAFAAIVENLGRADDRTLEDTLEALVSEDIENGFYGHNFRIVPYYEYDEDGNRI